MNINELADVAYAPETESVDLLTSAKEIGSAIAGIPKQAVASAAKLTMGGHYDPRDRGLATRLIESADADIQESLGRPGGEKKIFNPPGDVFDIRAKDSRQLSASMGGSLVAAGAGLGAGIPAGMAGAAVGGPVGGWVAGRGTGMAASGAAMFYNTKYDFEKEVHGSLDNYSRATRGRGVSTEEWEKFSDQIKDKTNAYALHEAAWEAVGNVFGFDIIRYAPGARKAATSALAKAMAGPMKNLFVRMGLKYTALQSEEMFTEVLTGKGQGKIEHSLGMRATEPTYGEVFREIAPATLAQTTLMAGAAGGISKAYDGAKTSFDKYVISRDADAMEVAEVVDELDAAATAPLYRTGPTAGIPMQPTVPAPGPAQGAPLGPQPEFTGQIAQDERDAAVTQDERDASFQAEIDKAEHGVTKGIERGQAESPFADIRAREQSKLDDEEIVFASLEDDLAASQPRGTGIDGEGEFFSFGSNWPEHLREKGYDKATILQAIKKQRILRGKEASGEEIKDGDYLTERQQTMLDGAVDGKKEAFQYEEDTARLEYGRLSAEEETSADFEAFMADDPIDVGAHEAATSPTNDTPEPTQAQKESGNYKMGRVKVSGMDISIENPKGSVRRGADEDGKVWETEMKSHYGYIKGTVGYDKDHLDVFLTDDVDAAETAFIIDQINPKTGKFDEHKVVIGPKSEDEALAAYKGNYEDGWRGAAGVTQMPMAEFKEWSQGNGPSKGRLSEAPVTKLPQRPEILTQKYVDEKYKAILAEPVEDAPDNLSDNFDPSKFGEEDILKELDNSDNVRLTKQSLRARIADQVGDMLETSRYESSQEGQEYEDRIDGLLKTVESYRRETKPEVDLVKAEQKSGAAPLTGLTITDHGKKSVIVTGVTSANTNQIKAIGGATWNKKAQGWQFDKKNEDKVRTALGELVAPTEAVVTPTPYGTKNKLVSSDRYAEIQKKLREKLNARASVGFDPELAMLGMEAAAYHVEAGAREFTDYAKKMIADFGEGAKPYLKAWYTTARNFPGLNNEGMNTEAELDKVDIDVILEDKGDTENVINKRSDTDLERDLQAEKLEDPVGEAGVQPELRPNGRPGEPGVPETNEVRDLSPGSLGATGHEAAPSGKRSDKSFYPNERKPRIAPGTAGSHDDNGSSNAGIEGLPPDTLPTETVVGTATPSLSLKEKIKLQADAKNVKIVPGNRANIAESLPFLHTGQLDDVAFAETRFLKPEGYGVMLTNSTGTGKTYSGLGVVKRYERQGKTNILIAIPDAKVLNDWIDSGKNLGLKITKLEDTNDAGTGIVATTYSNLGQNDALAKRDWDLVITDESHKLMQSQSGKPTLALETLRAITNHPGGRYAKYGMLYRKEIAAVARLRERKAKALKKDKIQARIDAANKKLDVARAKVFAQVDAAQGAGRTRAMFLSATPFAYEKTVQYAEGYLFDFPEDGHIGNSRQGGYEKFMVEHFGYEIKYHRLQQPPAEVNRGFMQREFNSWLKKEKVLSGRMLDVSKDYDRKFILTENAIGVKIDEGLQFLFDNPQFEAVRTVIVNKFDYLSRRYLLEAIKAREVLPLVKDHMAQGRKVVVFHDYKKGGGFNPFNVSYLQHSEHEVTNPETDKATTLGAVVTEFMAARPDLVNLDLSGMVSPIEIFRKTFTEGENLLVVNGNESQKDNLAAYKRFNDDKTGPQVLLIQSAKNAGWSGHDTTGKHQRTLFNLGLPTQPTMSIQQEGRVYRIGQASNAMFRYLNTGTNWERMAFATTIAERSSAAENLALGEEARALMDSFIDGFEASDSYPAGHEGEGTGGKERDQAAAGVLSEWDRAQTMYWAQTKKTSRTKATEGKDYFATPEPLGLKMVEWADIQSGDKVLEPSAGHGAIARWFPENVDRTVIEPSSGLASRLKMVTDAKLLQHNFEDLHVVNKYNAIVMNPPFGSGGSDAIKHLKKATEHLRAGGRVVALIPQGPAANKKFDKFLYAEDGKGRDLHLVASIALPQSTFTRAGTKVATRVVIIDKIAPDKAPQYAERDYTDAGTPKELFERLEGAEVRGRAVSESIVFTRRRGATDAAYLELAKAPEKNQAKLQKMVDAAAKAAGYNVGPVYHWSGADNKIQKFDKHQYDLGVHVGTKEQANERQKMVGDKYQSSNTYSLLVKLNNPLRLTDTGSWSQERIIEQLLPKGELSDVKDILEASTTTEDVVSAIEKQGYDGIIYANRGEVEGSLELFHPLQAMNESVKSALKRGDYAAYAEAAKKYNALQKEFSDYIDEHSKDSYIAFSPSQIKSTDPVTYTKEGAVIPLSERFNKDNDDIRYSRIKQSATKATRPMVALQVERVIKSLDLKNAPPVVVVKTETEYPQNVVKKINAEDAQGQVPAVYDPATQTVYIAADQVQSASEVRDYVLHEVTGHFGLRGLLGDKLDGVLDQVADHYGDAGLTDLAEAYGLDLTDLTQRRIAAEEKLAFTQQDDSVRGRSFWKKIYARIRELLRRLGFIQKMNDTDIAKLLNDAYAFARDGQATGQRGAPAFARSKPGDVITEHFDTSTATPISKFHDKMADTTKHWRTRFLDRLNPILDAGKKAGITPEENIAYKLARMMGNTPAILATFLKHGRLAWDGQALKVFEKGKGFLPWFKSLGDDGMNALYWMSTKRAEILEREGRENWLTKPVRDKIRGQIFKGLTAEQIEAKEKKFQAINDKIQAFNRNILDIAQEAGLISAENRALWMSDYYLPFYRIIEDDTTREEFLKSPHKSKKHISAMIKRLKGGEAKLGDPLSNMFQNWAHLINESQRNVARAEAFEMLKDTGIVEKLSKGDLIKILGVSQVKEYAVVKAGNSKATTVFDTLDEAQEFIDRQESNSYAIEPRKTNTVMMGRKEDQGVLSFQKNGQTVNFKVNDPELFNALAEADIKFLQSSLMQMFGGAKRLLTYGATFGAGFRIANTLRDSISTAIVSKSFIPIMDSMTGFMKVLRNHPEYIALMSSGSGFSGSGYLTGDAKALSEQVKKLSKADRMRLIDSPKKLLELWEHLGHASEMAARVQAYHRLQEKGATHLEAAFKAKDLLDFGMRGNAATVQLLTQMIPFVNARFQGLYKLGRAAKENPADFLLKGAVLTTISLILWGMNKDDDRYKELEDWERFAYHHFWIGDDHYRLPKAFELGALFSSLPETIADTLAGNEEGEHVMNFIVHTLRETFALDAPQLVKPLTEVWANKSSFTGRSIVPMGLQRLPAGQQADPWTSESLKALGAKLNISPKKAEHLVRGYMAILGTTLLTATDIAYTLVTEQDLPEGVKLAMEGGQIPGWSRFARGADAPRYTKQESKFREAWVETEKTMALVNHYRRTGDLEAAQDLVSNKKRMLGYRQYLKQYTKALQKIRKAQQAAWYSTTLSTEEKHKIMDQLNEKKRVIMKRAAELAKKAE